MSEYLGRAFEADLRRIFVTIFVAVCIAIVCAFLLGRCTRGIELQSPIKSGEQR